MVDETLVNFIGALADQNQLDVLIAIGRGAVSHSDVAADTTLSDDAVQAAAACLIDVGLVRDFTSASGLHIADCVEVRENDGVTITARTPLGGAIEIHRPATIG